jgi:hypothetical protein
LALLSASGIIPQFVAAAFYRHCSFFPSYHFLRQRGAYTLIGSFTIELRSTAVWPTEFVIAPDFLLNLEKKGAGI